MCYQEFIAYQCGHRSLNVVRPCPMTTAGHNFAICSILPDKPYYAETMCTPCERQLHSRWVLIREWEHRWLHERGVCGCEVVFPGLLDTPRVIGDESGAGNAIQPTGSAASPAGAEEVENNAKEAAASEGSTDVAMSGTTGQGGGLEKSTSFGGGGGRIPALFSESVTSTGDHRVAVRLPGLFAAEWKADHAILHETGKCHCAATFAPFKPQTSDDELNPYDRETLRQWRQREAERETSQHGAARQIISQVGDVARRIAEIKKTFGEFDIRDNERPSVNVVPRVPSTGGRASQSARATQGQGHQHSNNNNNNNSRHTTTRRPDNRRERTLPPRPQSQPTQPFTPSKQPHGQLVHASQASSSPANPTTPAHHRYYYYHPFPPTPPTMDPRTRTGTGTGMGMGYSPYPHPHPHHPRNNATLAPAHPAYATPATYADIIPFGASPWLAKPRRTPGMPWTAQGPGPYRTPGLIYHGGFSGGRNNNNNNNGNNNNGGSAYRVPALKYTTTTTTTNTTDITPAGADEERRHGGKTGTGGIDATSGADKGKGKATDYGDANTTKTDARAGAAAAAAAADLPLCGLPIGAGPEGTSYAPSWLECPLRRRSLSAGPRTTTTLRTTTTTTLAGRGPGQGQGHEEREHEEEAAEEEDGDENDGPLSSPSPPVRCRSAAT
ncbi:hypothetical protein MYCTH_2054417 [Thermothelomyces thermophilus ATCC 42464]|uniref:Uncharacterized protein n=1 Tax=Thermothelomyces thermophilus (strain ATCC 42464 / BCRC 31852 / DSM 1799) TaxID=573729 RepID=G2Q689_THET4|nr:uncharacterized protein MYCTH_2054417 [Thermothelomyces thermophilus ATCC 42464]AEO53859.1 hypothetical protein MYCTH_2054417 [Thermothelomyces thermophilus ATCC 42464]